MATASPTPPGLLTAEEFARRPDPGHPEELVRGRIAPMPPPGVRHGEICAQVVFLLKLYLSDHPVGRVTANDAGVVTSRAPDSVRGPDVSYYSHERLPRDRRPTGYADVPPDLVFEVLSPDDRWPKVLVKVAEYLDAGVTAVAVIDPERRVVQLFRADEPVRVLTDDDELALPDILADFHVVVGRLFD